MDALKNIIQCHEMVKVSSIFKGVVRPIKADQRFFKSITAGHFKESAFSLHFGNNMCPDFYILLFADFVNNYIESASKYLFILFADFCPIHFSCGEIGI